MRDEPQKNSVYAIFYAHVGRPRPTRWNIKAAAVNAAAWPIFISELCSEIKNSGFAPIFISMAVFLAPDGATEKVGQFYRSLQMIYKK